MDNFWKAIADNKYISVLVLLIICLLAFLPNLGVFDPSLMEARNFVTAREMVQEGNWLLPTMNGEPRFAKPPLPTWITALTIMIVGGSDNVFAMRLPAVLAGIILVLSIYFLVFIKTKNREQALFTGVIGATSLLILQTARTGSWDIHCHAWMVAAIACWVYALKSEKVQAGWLIISAFFMGLSFLSKGPVSFYTILLPYIIASIAIKDFSIRKLKFSQGLLFVLVLLLMSACWPLYVYLHKAEIGMEVMKAETTAWANRHVNPFYFYFHFPVYIGLWAVPFLASLFWKYAKDKFEFVNDYKFLIVWIISAFILLSVIPEKKERYLLPLIISMVFICGSMIYNFIKSVRYDGLTKNDKLVLTTHCIAVALFNFAAIIFIYQYGVEFGNASISMLVLIGVIFILINVCLVYYRFNPRRVLLLTTVAQLFIGISVIPFLPAFAYPNANFQSLEILKKNEKVSSLELYAIGDINLKQVYAIGRQVKIIKPRFEKTFPEKWPVVVLSVSPLETHLSNEWKDKIDIEAVDIINASRKKIDDVWYISIVDIKK